MTHLVDFKPKGTFQAVQYSGSTTHAQALQNWVNTGTYTQPHINTQDISPYMLHMPDDSACLLEPGNYLVLHNLGEDSGFQILHPDEVDMLFEINQ